MHEVSRFAHKEHPKIQFSDKPQNIWVCTETYEVHGDVLQPILKKYLDEERIVDQKEVRKGVWAWLKYRSADDSISTITFKSYDQGRKRFQGAGRDLISFDEEPPRDIWEECTVRESGGRKLVDGVWVEDDSSNLRIIMSMTPVNGMTWVYDEIYLATNNPDLKVTTASWEDNPWLTKEQKERMTRGLTPEALQVRKEGKFVRMTGLVCPWFDRSVHVQPIVFDPAWSLYRAIDFGFSNPCCVIWVGVDYDDNWYVYDGIYQPGLTNPQLKEAITRKDAQRYITNCWGDSAAMSDIQELNDMGLHVIPVEKVPGTGKENWDEYRARILMEQGKIQPNGRTKIVIGSNLVRYDEKLGREVNWAVSELEKLLWDEKEVKGEKKQGARWGPQSNHFVDSFTYFAHEYRREHGFSEKPSNPRLTEDRPAFYQPIAPLGSNSSDPFDI